MRPASSPDRSLWSPRAASTLVASLALGLAACDPPEPPDGELVDEDGDGFYVNADNPADRDCNDFDPQTNPSELEICDRIDNNCNGEIDEFGASGALEWWPDDDGDGFGRRADDPLIACFQPEGFSAVRTDCNDSDPDVFPQAPEVCDLVDNDCDTQIDEGHDIEDEWFLDLDGDGFGAGEPVADGCRLDERWSSNDLDCDDALDRVNPNAPERCDGVDNDCDELIDDLDVGDVVDARVWFGDADGDGYGSILVRRNACEQPGLFVDNALDCNDALAIQNPDTVWYYDGDRDGHGIAERTFGRRQCWQPIGYSIDAIDCDDTDPIRWATVEWHPDADRDGFGGAEIVGVGCVSQEGWTTDDQDCNDRDPNINPDAIEICDEGVDNNCDELIDDDDPTVQGRITWYPDLDMDGWGVASFPEDACVAPTDQFASVLGDCDDTNPSLSGDSEWYVDADRDGFGDPTSIPVVQCEPVPGRVPDGTDCDDTDYLQNPLTRWWTDADMDGLGVGIDFAFQGCTDDPALAMESGDCDDSDPGETDGGCFGEQLGRIILQITADQDHSNVNIGVQCTTDGDVIDFFLRRGDRGTTFRRTADVAAEQSCRFFIDDPTGDPTGDGGAIVSVRTCAGPVLEVLEGDGVSRQFSAPFIVDACSGCDDPAAENYDPAVIVPTDSCIYPL